MFLQCFIWLKGHIVFLTEQQHKKNISGNKKMYKNATDLTVLPTILQ